MKNPPKSFPIDNSAILFFSQLRPWHSNAFRFTVAFHEEVCSEILQQALERVYGRFPSIFAAFHANVFDYDTVPLTQAPKAQKDPGLLHTMTAAELEQSAIRVYYDGCNLSLEMFHALADGCGAIQAFRALIAEYLYRKEGIRSPEREQTLETEPDWQEDLRDAYLDHQKEKPGSVPNHYAYQIPARSRNWQVKSTSPAFDTRKLLAAAKAHGASLTAFLSCLMAEAIMDIQHREERGKLRPVRIMVPVDLRRLFPCGTLRNYILYGLPTLEPWEAALPRMERMRSFQQQLKQQATAGHLLPQVARNVWIQQSALYRCIPRSIKCGIMRIAYDLCGEPNSSITLTNLGPFHLSEELRPYVRDVDLTLTPRRRSPYNCSVLSFGDVTHINICRFGAQPDLEDVFFSKLQEILES